MAGEGARKRPAKSLKARAVALLARREYSRAELHARLAGGGDADAPEEAELDRVLDELAGLGYLSDERVARTVVRQKSGRYSRRAIGAALRARGVGDEAASAVLAGTEIDDQKALAALWRRRFGNPPADEREKARQVRFLQSRGFALAAILRLLRDPPDEADGGADPGGR
jgi:regulatory protein